MAQPKSFSIKLDPVSGAEQTKRMSERGSAADQLLFHEVIPQDHRLQTILTDVGVETVIGLCESDAELVRQGELYKLSLHPVRNEPYFQLVVLPEEGVFPIHPATSTLPHPVRKDLFAALV